MPTLPAGCHYTRSPTCTPPPAFYRPAIDARRDASAARETPIPSTSQVPEIDTNVRHPKSKNTRPTRFFLLLSRPGVRAHPGVSETIFFRHKREQSSKGRGTQKGACRSMDSGKGAIHRCPDSCTENPDGTPLRRQRSLGFCRCGGPTRPRKKGTGLAAQPCTGAPKPIRARPIPMSCSGAGSHEE
jgi:hypothetical protein